MIASIPPAVAVVWPWRPRRPRIHRPPKMIYFFQSGPAYFTVPTRPDLKK